MPFVPVNTATQTASAAIAANTVVRDSGTTEVMQIINVGDPISGQSVNINAAGYLEVASAPAAPATYTGTITTATSSVSAVTTSEPTVTISINGVYAGVNIGFFGSDNSGSAWYPVMMTRSDSSAIETTSGALTNISRAWSANCVGFTSFRVLASAWTSGTATIIISTVSLSTEPNPVVTIGASLPTLTTTYSGTQAVTVSSGTVNLGTTNGIQSTLYTNSTLAASTNSTTATMNYCVTNTIFYTATAAGTGTVTIYCSSDNVTFFAMTTTIAQPASAYTIVMNVLPARYYRIQSTVALTAFYLQFQGTY